MSYTAVLFMYNDEKRARFVIEGFKKHNPNIPLIVYNGGTSVKHFEHEYDIKLIEGPNLWHKFTRCPPGSFSYDYVEFMFKLGLEMETDHLIFLETDVKCNKPIEKEPVYDISGPTTRCGPQDEYASYDFWGGYLKGTNYDQTDWKHKYHTGMGATVFKKSYFEKCKDNLKYMKMAYELIPFHMCQDLHMTLLGRYSGCTMGDWSEASDTRGVHRKVDDTNWYYEPMNENCALIHNVKV